MLGLLLDLCTAVQRPGVALALHCCMMLVVLPGLAYSGASECAMAHEADLCHYAIHVHRCWCTHACCGGCGTARTGAVACRALALLLQRRQPARMLALCTTSAAPRSTPPAMADASTRGLCRACEDVYESTCAGALRLAGYLG